MSHCIWTSASVRHCSTVRNTIELSSLVRRLLCATFARPGIIVGRPEDTAVYTTVAQHLRRESNYLQSIVRMHSRVHAHARTHTTCLVIASPTIAHSDLVRHESAVAPWQPVRCRDTATALRVICPAGGATTATETISSKPNRL